MKAILVLLMFAVLLVAGSLSALPVDFTGQFTWGFMFDTKQVQDSYSNAYFNLTGKPSENTTVTVQVQSYLKGASQQVLTEVTGSKLFTVNAFTAYLDDLYISTNLGNILKLSPDLMTAKFIIGWYDQTATTYTFNDFGYENAAALDPGSMDTLSMQTGFFKSKLNVITWWNPMGPGIFNADTNPMRFGVNIFTSTKPFNISGWYYTNGKSWAEGRAGTSLGFSMPFGPVAFQADAEFAGNLGINKGYNYGLGVRADYKRIYLGGEMGGNQDQLNVIGVQFGGTVVPNVLFSTNGVAFNMVTKAFDHMEIGGKVNIDKLAIRFGYLLTDTGAAMGTMYAPNPLLHGGFFIRPNISW